MQPTTQPVHVRAWTTRGGKKSKKSGTTSERYDLGPSTWSLTFDTETALDPGQGIRLGGYQVRRDDRLREEGIFYEPDALSSSEIEVVRAYAETKGLVVRTREEFVEEVFLRTAWDRRGLIVGHNLPFDLARISIANAPAQSRDPSMRGGFSLTLSRDPKRSRIQVKRINAGGAFIRLTIPSGVSPEERNKNRGGKTRNHHGYFLDTATLGGAMLGGRPTLKALAKLLQTDAQKAEAEHGAEINADYLDYMRGDVQVTYECSVELRRRYDVFGLPKKAWEIYSEAGIGKAHLQKIGLTPFRESSDWADSVLATVMETYYGGRTETMIRRTAVPGVYVDFKSQYPTSYCLQGLQRYLIAGHVKWRYEDSAELQALLDDVSVDAVLDPALWPSLDALVLVAPDGDRLPTRSHYARRPNRRSGKHSSRSLNVAVPYRSGGPPQWYTLADCIASKLMTGTAPRVVKTLRFEAGPSQAGLNAIDVAGDPAYRVVPHGEDFIARLVEMRDDVKTRQKTAAGSDDGLTAASREATQQAMKATANSSAYGSAIEMNPTEHRKPRAVYVQIPDGQSYQASVTRTEQVGKWFHPLIATLVAGGGRLLLAAAMRLLADRGGHYAFCDTDSLFIVATRDGRLVPCIGGTQSGSNGTAIQSLDWTQVQEIVDRFGALNPYTTIRGSILEIENENYDPLTHKQREIECFAVASKRYSLFTRDDEARPKLITSGDKLKRSEHGLGHLLPPLAPKPDTSNREWMDVWWEHLIHTELGFDHPEPDWFDEPAIGRATITSQRDLKTFKAFNADQPYSRQVKPWGFLCLAHPASHERARPDGPGSLIAPFERDPAIRRAMEWTDRDHPERGGARIHTGSNLEIRDARYGVLSYRDYFTNYLQHPETKATDPADGQPCHTWTRGLLRPRHITAAQVLRVGRESNRLADTDVVLGEEVDAVIVYPPPQRRCRGCEQAVSGRRQWCSEACRKRAARRMPCRWVECEGSHQARC